jgi:hypothetical protein
MRYPEMTDSQPNSTESGTRRHRTTRRTIAIGWCIVGAGGALWLGAPGALVRAAGGATGALLRSPGVRTGDTMGSSAVAVSDALIAPDFTLRLHPAGAHLGADDRTTLDLHLGSILALAGRASLRAMVTSAAGSPARGLRTQVSRAATIGGMATLAVVTHGARSGLYTLTLTATQGSVTHVASAPIRVS